MAALLLETTWPRLEYWDLSLGENRIVIYASRTLSCRWTICGQHCLQCRSECLLIAYTHTHIHTNTHTHTRWEDTESSNLCLLLVTQESTDRLLVIIDGLSAFSAHIGVGVFVQKLFFRIQHNSVAVTGNQKYLVTNTNTFHLRKLKYNYLKRLDTSKQRIMYFTQP